MCFFSHEYNKGFFKSNQIFVVIKKLSYFFTNISSMYSYHHPFYNIECRSSKHKYLNSKFNQNPYLLQSRDYLSLSGELVYKHCAIRQARNKSFQLAAEFQ